MVREYAGRHEIVIEFGTDLSLTIFLHAERRKINAPLPPSPTSRSERRIFLYECIRIRRNDGCDRLARKRARKFADTTGEDRPDATRFRRGETSRRARDRAKSERGKAKTGGNHGKQR